MYEKAFAIAEAIQKNELRPLKDWCYEHSHYLARIKSELEFKLICCGFINILNNSGGARAVEFLRKEVMTLSLTEEEKEELKKLTFMVLTDENGEEYEYYSDEEKLKEAIQSTPRTPLPKQKRAGE
jgi:uncharacterized protein Smg (DUF494 family)